MLKRFREYIIGESLNSLEDTFERSKIEMFFNIATISSVLYVFAAIPLLYNQFWYVFCIILFGLTTYSTIFYSLKKSISHSISAFLFMVNGMLSTTMGFIINEGQSAYLIFGLTIAIIPLVFLIQSRFWGYFYLVYSLILISLSILISYDFIAPVIIGIDFSHDQIFYRSPNPFVTVLPLIFLIYLLYEFSLTEKKSRNLIVTQKEIAVENKYLLEDKNKLVNENINFASQIQRSLLPDSRKVDTLFKENFILFNPVDQLSGDLYWINQKDDTSFFAVIDSSESGVSGALISYICFNALNLAINEINLKQPAKILDYVKDYFTHTLNKEKRKSEISLALCSYDKTNKILNYAGEDNPIFIIRKGDLTEFKAQQSSPEKLKEKVSYKNQKISLETDDIIYIFSDGFANQNKNMSSEKLKYSVFKQFLLSISTESMPDQKKKLEGKLKEWLNYEQQSDDVCILGLKVP